MEIVPLILAKAGLGTYVAYEDVNKSDFSQRVRAAAKKLKDLAIGTSLSNHVLGGYKFLMRYYAPGDQIYIFGFSRGAYTARFLAEMLDDVGLLPTGNEEMVNFAWDIFSKWQTRGIYEPPKPWNKPSKEYEKVKALGQAMAGFKETFSRPLEPIRFLGLFDTVNSVPEFEVPWMDRRRFPYTPRSNATEIWHAVSIDERRVKFRPDLIYQSFKAYDGAKLKGSHSTPPLSLISPETLHQRNHENPNQQVHEVWFAGNHGDVGGGWATKRGTMNLSHFPLIWMIRAAKNAGLRFDITKLVRLETTAHDLGVNTSSISNGQQVGEKTVKAKIREMMLLEHHDMLTKGPQISWRSALRWNLMEWIPFRRMDMKDGRWVPKRWPPSLGETRDIPDEAKVHGSVIYRLQMNLKYRPRNLILGGGRVLETKEQVIDFHEQDWEILPDFVGLPILDRIYVRRKKPHAITL